MLKKASALVLLFALVCSLSACGGADVEAESAPPSASPASETPSDYAVHVGLLPGTAALGAVSLASSHNDTYTVTVVTDDDYTSLTGGLLDGTLDIIALPTNLAAALYNKTDAQAQLLALTAEGSFSLLERGRMQSTIETVADLSGRTLYAEGKGASGECVLRYLLSKNGLDLDHDLSVVWLSPHEMSSLASTGDAGDLFFASAVTAAALSAETTALSDTRGIIGNILDVSEQWNSLTAGAPMLTDCFLVATDFAADHPDQVATFLEDYTASLADATEHPELLGSAAASLGITESDYAAELAFPTANLIFLSGQDMQADLQSYFELLYSVSPDCLGGGIPDDSFYYIP